MPTSGAERTKKCLTRKREVAREAGLCYTCRKGKPNPGRTTCISCNAAALERQRRKRRRNREAVRLQQVLSLQEDAGDEASTYHLYTDAAHYYQEALNTPGLALPDRERVAEKIGEAFFLSGDIKFANLWFERLLTMNRSHPQGAAKHVEMLFQIVRQLALNCEGEMAQATMARAVQIAKISGDAHLTKLTLLRMVEPLYLLGRFDEAAETLREVGHIGEDSDALIRGYYFVAHAMAASVVGNAENAYRNFESAIELAKKHSDSFRVAQIWSRYGLTARDLGDIIRAKACYEQAIFVARQYRITFLVALVSLSYAELLACMGQPSAAHPYLVEALSLGPLPPNPNLDVTRTMVGIPLALQVRDEAALAQCVHPKTIELAFQSEIPTTIGGVVCAFAQFYISQGRPRAARVLLHRALEKISNAYRNPDFLIAIAQYGALSDIPRARALLEARIALPHSAVFQAGLALFNAFVEQRRGSLTQAYTYAQDAAARFDTLQWHACSELARSIIPGGENVVPGKPVPRAPFSHMPVLTAREREVAALVLRGLTNREIANELTIALHTVEKHMNSIMNRLGVRSRFQVADLLESAD